MSNAVDDKTWQLLLERDDHKCLNCNSDRELAPAHYKSRGSKEGTNDLENLMLLCFECHRKSHDGRLKIKKINNHFYFREI